MIRVGLDEVTDLFDGDPLVRVERTDVDCCFVTDEVNVFGQ